MKITLHYLDVLQREGETVEALVGDVRRANENADRIKEIEDNRQKSLVKTALDGAIGVTKSVLGVGIACEEVIASRRDACETCSYRKGKRCGKCGCVIRHKTRVAGESCPMGYWVASDICD